MRRSPKARLILILAALSSLVGGYYLGQHWQRRPLTDLSAIVYPSGLQIDYPAGLTIPDAGGTPSVWRLFLVADTREQACSQLLDHYAFVFNRLAAWPSIQARLRLSVLAYDRPDATSLDTFVGGRDWVDVITGDTAQLDSLSAQLGILPGGGHWCSDTQANAILVSPERANWALIPHEQAAIMARNIGTIIDFVE